MTSAVFDRAIAIVLEHEGAFVDDAADPGGATNWGVSLRWLRSMGHEVGDLDGDGDVDRDDVAGMTVDQAVAFYGEHWWQRYHYDELEADVAIKVFDLSINMGPGGGHKVLQRAARSCGVDGLVDDGVIGPKTRSAIAAMRSRCLVAAMRSEAAGYYRSLVAADPGRRKFLAGWLKRAYA